MKSILLSLVLALLLFSCSREDSQYIPIPITLEVSMPSNFPELLYNVDLNPPTQEGFELGKTLFYDGNLSSNGVISCGFCHEQAFAFTHHGHTVSHGVDGGLGFRNSQPIQNLAFFNEFTWDGAAIHLDMQPVIPVTSPFEMGETISSVLDKLRADANYKKQFERAFGDSEINSERMLKALSQFMVMMISSNSKYDKYVRQEDGITLTQTELDGKNTFEQKCASCHATDLFTDQTYRNNGLPFNSQYPDEEGRQRVTGFASDFYKFRVPSLRNVEHSYPYMHDGRFGSLEVVLDFYDSGMVDNGNVDPALQREDGTFGIELSDYEKNSIITFLKTLTDNEFLNDERFSEY
ncbi:cytochrome-c peroxidase [Mangrovimonas aestuarii]|uniref:cytochrome-c peroxidase n=1 Tax=Mangrovimonas aestuarii TaxID=3018443 RepID=UPI002379EC6D|nr:cytochrome c peroxidase [Mangrovimonas aestuarii]